MKKRKSKEIDWRKLPAVGSPTLTIMNDGQAIDVDCQLVAKAFGVASLIDFLRAMKNVGGTSEAKKLIEVIES